MSETVLVKREYIESNGSSTKKYSDKILVKPFNGKFILKLAYKPISFTIWSLIHFIYSFTFTLAFFQRIILWLPISRGSKVNLKNLRETENYTKHPKHLAIAIHEKELNAQHLKKLVKIITWAWVANVKVVSIYEQQGFNKTHIKELNKGVEKALNTAYDELRRTNDIDEKRKPRVKICNFGDECISQMKKYSQSLGTINICLYSDSDSKTGIVNAAKALFQHRIYSNPTISLPDTLNKDLDYVTLDTAINKSIGWPEAGIEAQSEPDLMMVLGNIQSTIGFLPWHIRLTEIHWLPSIENVRIQDFLSSFQKFNKCEQRVGT